MGRIRQHLIDACHGEAVSLMRAARYMCICVSTVCLCMNGTYCRSKYMPELICYMPVYSVCEYCLFVYETARTGLSAHFLEVLLSKVMYGGEGGGFRVFTHALLYCYMAIAATMEQTKTNTCRN